MSTKSKKEQSPEDSRNSAGQFKAGQSGNPDGRKRGSKNKRTLEVLEACQEKDFDPLKFLIDVAKNEGIEWSHRIKAACEVNACLNPKLKAIEHSGGIGRDDVQEMSKEELLNIVNGDRPQPVTINS